MVMVRSQGWTVKIEPCQPAITATRRHVQALNNARLCARPPSQTSRVARHARHRCAHGGKATSHDDTAPDARSSERRASAAPPTPGSKARCPATACPVSARSDSGRPCRACRVNRNRWIPGVSLARSTGTNWLIHASGGASGAPPRASMSSIGGADGVAHPRDGRYMAGRTIGC